MGNYIKKGERDFICLQCNETFKSYRDSNFCNWKCRNAYSWRNKHSLIPETVELTLSRILNGANYRAKRKGFFNEIVTKKQLIELLIKQNYKCAKTGVLLKPSKKDGYSSKYPETISIDRIDNSKGYEISNIQLVSTIYNFAKNNFTEEEVEEMCKNLINFKYGNTN